MKVGDIKEVNARVGVHYNVLFQFLMEATDRHDMNGTADPQKIRTFPDVDIPVERVQEMRAVRGAWWSSRKDPDLIWKLMSRCYGVTF